MGARGPTRFTQAYEIPKSIGFYVDSGFWISCGFQVDSGLLMDFRTSLGFKVDFLVYRGFHDVHTHPKCNGIDSYVYVQ